MEFSSKLSEDLKQTYIKGAIIIEEMNFQGLGGLDPKGEDILFPINTLTPPKCGQKLVLGIELLNFLKKGTNHLWISIGLTFN